MNGIDCLFVHTPNLSNFYLPLGQFINNNYIPMGLLALADLVSQNGYKTEIIHMGVENLIDSNFSLVKYVIDNQIKVVGLSLFWFHQSYDVIDLAEKIKKGSPNTFVFLGGLTASYYADEILTNFKFVDAIVIGYGENSIIPLLDCVIQKKYTLSKVHNLFYRIDHQVTNTKLCFIDEKLFHELNYTNLKVIKHFEMYIQYFGLHEMPLLKTETHEKIMNQTIETKMFPLSIGRGCSTLCSYCGGNRDTCHKLYGDKFLLYRTHDEVLSDIESVITLGYTKVFICFDPSRDMQNYYIELFKKISQKKIRVSMYFECWSLPSEAFIYEFSKTFPDENSHLLLSIDTLSEDTRKKNKGEYFSNEELIKIFQYLDEKKVRYDLCFAIGLPGSTYSEDMKTYEFIKNILQRYKSIGRINTFLIDLVPGSPLYENPKQYGISISKKSFLDYYNEFSQPLRSTYALCNYKLDHYFYDGRDNTTIEKFSEMLQLIKCQYFCGVNEQSSVNQEENINECCRKRQMIYEKMGFNIKAQPFSNSHTYNDELAEVIKSYDKSRIRYE